MTVYIVKSVSKGAKNTRWQFADGYGSLFDGLLPTSGNYRVGQEIDKDAFSSIRALNNGQHCQIGQNGVMNSVEQIQAIRDAERAAVAGYCTHDTVETSNYVNALTGEVIAQNMTEAEFEAMMETEF